MPRPPIAGVYETVLYCDDVDELTAFYAHVLGLRVVEHTADGLLAALRLPDGGVLLLFNRRLAAQPGRMVPSHGTAGPGHVAFRIADGDLDAWGDALGRAGVPVERVVEWRGDARSLYVRDPAGNSVELTGAELWPR